MYGGAKQGGGGQSQFLDLTGLFPTKKGTGMVGFVKPDAFGFLRGVLDDAEAAGVDLMIYVGKPNREGAKEAARVSVAPSNKPSEDPKRNSFTGQKQYNASVGNQSQRSANAEASKSQAKRTATQKQNPPPDPLDDFLESFDQ